VRCHALALLHLLANHDYKIYRLPLMMSDDQGYRPTIFLKELLLTMAEATCCKTPSCYGARTDGPGHSGGGSSSTCCPYCSSPIAWICLTNTFGAAPGSLSDSELLDFWMNNGDRLDWTKILCQQDIPHYSQVQEKTVGKPVLSFDFPLFVSLHGQTVALLKTHPRHEPAKRFLRDTLGACHELFRNCMRRMISGDVYATPQHERGNNNWKQILVEMGPALSFILAFTRCLAVVPVDRETMSLVRRARTALLEPFLGNAAAMSDPSSATRHLTTALASLLDWQQLHDETDEVRWTKFQKDLLFSTSSSSSSSCTTTTRTTPRTKKTFWKEFKNVRKRIANSVHGGSESSGTREEMCANCFVLESDLKREANGGGYLSKCSKCLKLKYCSRECQVEHWKRAHKKGLVRAISITLIEVLIDMVALQLLLVLLPLPAMGQVLLQQQLRLQQSRRYTCSCWKESVFLSHLVNSIDQSRV
jgi:MYND finger